jgi:hypothetical protein
MQLGFRWIKFYGVFLTLGLFFFFIPLPPVYAATLTNRSDLLTRLKIAEGSSHEISFNLSAANSFAAGETITLDFDEDSGGWNVDGLNAVLADFAFDDGTPRALVAIGAVPSCTGLNGVNDISIGINNTTGVVTFLACGNFVASASSASVVIRIGTAAGGTDRLTNPVSVGQYQVAIGGTFGDTGGFEVEIVNEDQVVVTGTVPNSVSFTTNDTSIGFGILTPDSSRYATGDLLGSASEQIAHTFTIGTNAVNGYSLTVNGTSLTSAGGTIDEIGPVNTPPSVGTEQFGLRITASGGAGTVSAPYNGSGFAFDIANFPDLVASASTSSSNTTYSFRYLTNISPSSPAGIYSAALIYVATGNF